MSAQRLRGRLSLAGVERCAGHANLRGGLPPPMSGRYRGEVYSTAVPHFDGGLGRIASSRSGLVDPG